MPAQFLNWLFVSDYGLVCRIGAGIAFLACLAGIELYRKGSQARRWKEYLFLLGVVAAAMLYGIANDQITCSISWEYFYHHDDRTAEIIRAGGFADGRPDGSALRWAAFQLGMKATWTAGLIIGVAMLIANNPHKRMPQLPYRRLIRIATIPWAAAASCAILLAGWFHFTDFSETRPYMTVWGTHLGGYAGGGIGMLAAVVTIIVLRRSYIGTGSTDPRSD